MKLEEEYSLLNFILKLCEDDSKYSSLFEYLNFNNISEKSFALFIENLNVSIWRSICQRLNPTERNKTYHERYHEKVLLFNHIKNHEFKGIMYYLSEKTGGNIQDNGTIKIDSNSICNNECLPRNLVDYESNNYYYSNNDENAFVCFEFKDKKV